MTEKDFFVHESAYVDDGAVIGEGTQVWHFSHLMNQAILGKGCKLGQNVFIANHVRVGNNVKIQNNVSIYEGVTLEDDVFCGPSCVFTNVKNPRSGVLRNTSADYTPTIVRKGATIGANATIVCGTTIGEFGFVAAGAVVSKDVPAHAMVAGVPARVRAWMCECGTTLQRESDETFICPVCGNRYEKMSEVLGLKRSDQ